jgi:hypothetical protein
MTVSFSILLSWYLRSKKLTKFSGATSIWTTLGDGRTLCKSEARYAEAPEYVFKGSIMGHSRPARDHISSMSSCHDELQENHAWIRKNQSLQVFASYDYDVHAGNVDEGKKENVSTKYCYSYVSA